MAVSLLSGIGGTFNPKPVVHPAVTPTVLGNPTTRLPGTTGFPAVTPAGAVNPVADPGTFTGAGVTGVQPKAPGTPGYDPNTAGIDWGGLIGSSYEVSAAQALMASEMARARSNLKADLRQNFIDLGLPDTSQLGNLGQYINKGTIQAAINNKYSTYGQVALAEARANASNDAELAARGILQSGQTTSSREDVINQAEQARYMGLRDFLRSGQTGLEHVGDVQAQMAQGVMQAQFAAAQRIAQQQAAAAAAAAASNAQIYGPSYPSTPSVPEPTVPGGGGASDFVAPTYVTVGNQTYVGVPDPTTSSGYTPWLNTGLYRAGRL